MTDTNENKSPTASHGSDEQACTFCGTRVHSRRPASQGPIYCCSGCLFADSLSQSLRQERLSLWMVSSLATLFIIFNQGMFMLLGRKYYSDDLFAGEVLLVISLFLGALAWGFVAVVVYKQQLKGTAPLPVGFGSVSVVFLLATLVAALMSDYRDDLAIGGMFLSIAVVLYTFVQHWLMAPFRKKAK